MSAEMPLRGKTAVIIGGRKGIGFAAAQTFHQQDAKLVLSGRKQESLDHAVEPGSRGRSIGRGLPLCLASILVGTV